VESTQGTPLANVADVSVEIKADSTAMAGQYLNQISALLQDYTTMSVSVCRTKFVLVFIHTISFMLWLLALTSCMKPGTQRLQEHC